MTDYFKNWSQRRIATARALERGEAGGDYHEGILVASAVISTITTIVWPRQDGERGTDRKRFVEAWTKLSPPELGAGRISVPLLVTSLERTGDVATAGTLRSGRRSFGPDGEWMKPILGDEVDASSDEVHRLAPALSLRTIRGFSYGNVFYEEVRSTLVHQYQIGESADWRSGRAEKTSRVPCYTNPLAAYQVERGLRLIYFPFGWIEALLHGIAARVEPVIDCWPMQRLPRPASWWLDGD